MSIVVRKDWLNKVQEETIEPNRRIVDPHHHFFVKSEVYPYYDLNELRADAGTHGVEQTVYLQCWEGHRETGPEHLKPVGETEWVDSIAKEAAKNPKATQIGAIMGTGELRGSEAQVHEFLDAHMAASTLFRGIRQIAAFDDTGSDLLSMEGVHNGRLYDDAAFRRGFKILSDKGLAFDGYHYYHQTACFTDLARAFPGTTMVIDHLGTPLGVGAYKGRQAEIFAQWKKDLTELAKCANVNMKLGGLAMPWCGMGFEADAAPPSSDAFVARQNDYYQFAIQTFGPERCMFESNFPVDRWGADYPTLWNAFKRIAAGASDAEKADLFAGTANRFYRLEGVL
jgi:predicted TIM-barrel fold metal-dependent hydrolase